MIYIEADEKNITFKLKEYIPNINDKDRNDIEDHWQNLKNQGKHVFNAEILSCNSVEFEGEKITFNLYKTDYKTYSWTRHNIKSIKGTYAVGCGTFLYEPDSKSYVFVERKGNLAFDGEKISFVGGVVDWKGPGIHNLNEHMKSATLNEIEEELENEKKLTALDLTLVGLYLDENTYKLELAYLAQVSNCKLKGEENVSLLKVKKKDIYKLNIESKSKLEISTLNHLNHISYKLVAI